MRPCLIVITAACLLACTKQHIPTVTKPSQLCGEGRPSVACRTAAEIEALLAGDLNILEARSTSTGLQRAHVMTLRSPGPHAVVFRAKWRAHSTTTRTNSPRFELAAYAVQKLFLDPNEYVVPPTAGHCFSLAAYREHVDAEARETFPGSGCVYGVLSYWLEGVTTIEKANRDGWFHGEHRHLLDPGLLASDPAYRSSIAHVNLLAYVIKHGDTHHNNFVVARSETQPVLHTIFSVDNSKSFTLAPNRRIQPQHNWSMIQLPSVPRDAIRRLRTADFSSLSQIARFQPANGRLVATAPDATKATTGVDWAGDRLMIGLTEPEIADLRVRVDELLGRIDRNELALY